MRLQNKVTIVTGGASGIGKAIAEGFASEGTKVAIADLNLEAATATAEKIGPTAIAVKVDVGNMESAKAMAKQVEGCVAVASCLGHNMSFKGIFGQPRRLVTNATRRLCQAIKANPSALPTKFVLMNSAGNSNRDLHEPMSFAQKCIIGLIRLLVPPHADNENAADYLRTKIGQNDGVVEWAVVRPDKLINEEQVTAWEIHPSPIRSAIFNSGLSSRINVGNFMADLITDDDIWNQWKGKMPVIYNSPSDRKSVV